MPWKEKCTQAKQSSISILQWTTSQSKDHLKDLVMPVTGRNMSQPISQLHKALLPELGRGAPQQGCWRDSGAQTPAHRRRLPSLCPADNQPGVEKPLRLPGGGHTTILNLSDLSSPPERTSFEVSAPTPIAVLQWLIWFCHSLKDNFLLHNDQYPLCQLTQINNCTIRR